MSLVSQKEVVYLMNKLNKRLFGLILASFSALLFTNPAIISHASKVTTTNQPRITMAKPRPKNNKVRKPSAETRFHNEINAFGKTRRFYRHPSINWNARDLGGYRTHSGLYTKCDNIFRGGKLQYISKHGIRTMKRLHINEVIDLRSPNWHSGVNRMPDPGENHTRYRGLHVKYKIYPTNTDAEKANYMPLAKKYGEYYCYGKPFVTYHSAIWSYRKAFHQLLNHKHGAVYIHCLEGHDRTGVTSALILNALGVPRKTVYKDFLVTEYYQRKYPYVMQNTELNHFYNTIHANFKNVNHYLRYEIGLTPRKLRKLRSMYLTKKRQNPKLFVD